ncbi:MAG: sulfurtransferase complex subunit TusB [Candidatus Arsenophonus melophagi]|nr:sulfurtransferase complex subunit TusB [Candidatus Arsenophonus melophagi]
MLYTISASPYYSDFNALINLVTNLDEVLLIQDAVLIAHKIAWNNKDNNYLIQLREKGVYVFALQDDIEARGLMPYVSSYVQQISYIDFVQLTVKHLQYCSW